MKIRILTLPLMTAALALAGCSHDGEEPTDKHAENAARSVSVGRVELREIRGALVVSGLLVPREEAAVGTELSGYRVADVLFEEGAAVSRGQPLARLDDGLLRAQINQAHAVLAQSKAQAAQARNEAARVNGLDGTGVLADEQIESRRTSAMSAVAAVDVAQAQLDELLERQRRMIVRAPVSGIILERMVRPGDIAAPGSPMFRIARNGLVELDAEIPEDALGDVRQGQAVRVTLPSGDTFQGSVRLVSPRIDPQTKLAKVRVQLPRDEQLRAGGFAQASLVLAAGAVPAVPDAAVQFEAGGPLIVTLDKANRAHRVPVKTGARGDAYVALEKGPAPGTRIALGGGAFLLEGDLVDPTAVSSSKQDN